MADERGSGTTRRRALAGAVGPLGVAGVLALACAPGGQGDQAGRAGGEGGRLKTGVRLLAIGWGGPPAAQARGSIVEQFMRQHPGITAEYSDLAGGNPYFDKLRADLAAGTPPDVFFMNPYNFTLYAVQKALLNLAPLIKRDRTDLSDFYPVALQLFAHRGNQTGMPLHFNGINLAFNKAAFQAINQPVPSQSLNLNSAFTTGRTAMFWPSGAPQFGTIRPAAQFDWDVGILPVGRGRPAPGSTSRRAHQLSRLEASTAWSRKASRPQKLRDHRPLSCRAAVASDSQPSMVWRAS